MYKLKTKNITIFTDYNGLSEIDKAIREGLDEEQILGIAIANSHSMSQPISEERYREFLNIEIKLS